MSGVKLPKKVREAGEASDRALEELRNPTPDDAGQYVSKGEPTPDTEPKGEGEPQPTAPAADDSPATPDAPGTDNGDLEIDWKAEAKAMKVERDRALSQLQTLQGKYNAEVPRLHEQVRTLTGKVEELEKRPSAQEATKPSVDLEQIREMYGDEMADAMAARDTTIARLEKALETATDKLARVDDIEQRTEASADQTMFDAIAKEHSDWEEVNELASFHAFLAEIDPNTGEPRQMVINRAQARRDPVPIIRMLSAFKRAAKTGSEALGRQVVPGSTGRPDDQPQPDTKVYAGTEVDAFFKRLAQDTSRGIKPNDETIRLEAQYEKALREGRVNYQK